MPLRLGRSGEAGGRDSLGKAREDRRGIAWPTRAGELAETPSQFPTPKPHPAYVGPGDIGGGLGRSGVAGERGHPGRAGEKWRVTVLPTQTWEAC